MGDEGVAYNLEDEEAELRDAAEVFEEFLTNRKAEIIREFEEKYLDDGSVYDNLAELRVMRKYRDMSAKMISLGEIAEERMSERDG